MTRSRQRANRNMQLWQVVKSEKFGYGMVWSGQFWGDAVMRMSDGAFESVTCFDVPDHLAAMKEKVDIEVSCRGLDPWCQIDTTV